MRRLFCFIGIFLFSCQIYSQSFITGIPWQQSSNPIFFPADTITGNWIRIDSLPQPLYGVTSYYWADSNKIFLCGGVSAAGVVTNCYFYNITANTYETKASLPAGRAFGKLVRVKDSLYLIGSINSSFGNPDGKIYRYYPAGNLWQEKTVMPIPYLHESAVVVWQDSLIITIGGSASGFNSPANTVRIYDPYLNSWRTLTGYIRLSTTAHAECINNTIVVLGGLVSGTTHNQAFDKGLILNNSIETLSWWQSDLTNPFGTGIYRVGGSRWNNYALFGPAMHNNNSYGQIWGYNADDSTWRRFLPNTIDTAGNRPTIAVRTTNDSVYFYLFGGILNTSLSITSHSERYAFANPVIGITKNSNAVPAEFVLYQNYPNPFNPKTKIKFSIPTPLIPPEGGMYDGDTPISLGEGLGVRLCIYDILGRELATLVNEQLKPGTYETEFDASELSSGMYFYTLSHKGKSQTKRMILLK